MKMRSTLVHLGLAMSIALPVTRLTLGADREAAPAKQSFTIPTKSILDGDWKAARPLLEKTAEKDAENEVVQYLLSNVYFFEGEYAKQRSAKRKSFGKKDALERILDWCKDFAASHPTNAIAHLLLADVYGGVGQYDKAFTENSKALEIDPRLVNAKINIATCHLQSGEVEKAISVLEQATKDHPTNPVIYCNLAAIWCDKRNSCDRAIKLLRKAIELDAKMPGARFNLGTAYEAQDDHSEAIKHYQKAVELDPEFASAHERIGYIHCTRGEWDKAIPILQKAIELDPKGAEAYCILGIAFLEGKGDRARAIPLFKQAVEIAPNGESGRKARLCLERVQ